MKHKEFSFFLIIALIIPLSTFPTCIVLFKDKNHIYVAADTKRLHINSPSETVTKVYHDSSNRYYFTSAGFTSRDEFNIINNTLFKKQSYKGKLNSIKTKLCSYFDTAIMNRAEIPQNVYDSFPKYGIFHLAIFYAKRDTLHIDSIGFGLRKANGVYHVYGKIKYDLDSVYLGITDIKGTPEDLSMRNEQPIEYAVDFICAERKHGTNYNFISDIITPFILDKSNKISDARMRKCN
jgi:hypothetical protein